MPEEQKPAPLNEKIKHLLQEALILITAVEVVVGFQFRSVFESGFEKLPVSSQYLKLGGLGCMLGALALFIAPAAYHRIVNQGEDTEELHQVSSIMLAVALLLFAGGLGIDIFVAFEKVGGRAAGFAWAVAAIAAALVLWYGIEMLDKVRSADMEAKTKQQQKQQPNKGEKAKLKDKVE